MGLLRRSNPLNPPPITLMNRVVPWHPAKTPIITNLSNTLNSSIGIYNFRIKKQHNKKFDKLVTLISYTIASADKALKYVNLSVNFEAEFAYKLYTTDR
jgi:ABC-type methionine transport system ATPase subunit